MERRTAPSPVGAGMALPHLLPFHPSLLLSRGRNEGHVSFVNQEHERPIIPQPEVNLPDNDHNPMASIRRRRDCFEMYQIYEILKAHSANLPLHETREPENWVAGNVLGEMRTRLNPSNRSVEELEEPAFRECAKNHEEQGFSSLKSLTDTYFEEDDTEEEEWFRVKDLRLCSCCKQKCHNGPNCRRVLNVTTGLEETEREEEEAEEVTREGVGVETIKLHGHVENKDVVMLIDSGSTHSFLDPKIVKDMASVERVKNYKEHGFLSLKNQTETYVKEDDTEEEEWLRVKDLRLCSHCKKKCHNGQNTRRALNATTGLEETKREEEEAEEVTRGGLGVETIMLLGRVENKDIVMMIDSGSTHSFLDPTIVKDMASVECVKSRPLQVTVANGNELSCDLVCPNFKWTVQGETFVKEMRLVRMGGCDMVLGMDWIDEFTPVQLNTRPPKVTFWKEGRLVRLYGVTDITEEAVGNSSRS
ncbi:unnamed protein product [Cuscuta epithymum]|uniref:Uncharacterized protein n=1 Tax=Cuscuta epithymum TaxID=186058 RepID=A0AAV0D1I0_9ASTE|nr:unnamed protein product [Cuscuta epithymum]